MSSIKHARFVCCFLFLFLESREIIFLNLFQHRLVEKQTIEGTREGGRLGHALTNLGDIDQDGYNGL